MDTRDLFGYVPSLKTQEQEYNEYIHSKEWKIKCKQALERADDKCEECRISKLSRKLEVHHLAYENFRHEHPEDLMVLCNICHTKKDRQRARETEERNYTKLQEARFIGWARKVYGDDWMDYDDEIVYLKYEAWLDKIGEY